MKNLPVLVKCILIYNTKSGLVYGVCALHFGEGRLSSSFTMSLSLVLIAFITSKQSKNIHTGLILLLLFIVTLLTFLCLFVQYMSYGFVFFMMSEDLGPRQYITALSPEGLLHSHTARWRLLFLLLPLV